MWAYVIMDMTVYNTHGVITSMYSKTSTAVFT